MNTRKSPPRSLRILLAVVPQSPYNRSIWTGFLEGFQSLGHMVQVVDSAAIPDPDDSRPVDLLFAVHGFSVPAERVHAYRERSTTTAVYLLDEPYEVDRTEEWAAHYDWVFSVDAATVPIHRQHTRAAFLPLGYNPAIFNPDGPATSSRILVLGTPFSAREEHLSVLREQWGKHVTWVGPGWKQFSPLGEHYEQFVTPVECAAFYRGADININIHRDSTWSHFGELNKRGLEATHLNPRFWETAACNSLQLCSHRSDIDIFAPKCPAFRTVDEFAAKVDYFLSSHKTRKSIAKQVYSKVKSHTYASRCSTVISHVAGTTPE